MKRQITEYLVLDLERELWICQRCNKELGSARENYKRFLLVSARDPREVHPPYTSQSGNGYTLAPDPAWISLIEYYCPSCGTMMEVEYLPPGHPLTHDIDLDIDKLKRKYLGGERG